MNTNAHSISTPLKVRHYFEVSKPGWKTNFNPPLVSLLWRSRGDGGGKAQCLQSICFGNKWIQVFLESAPEMRRSVIEGQGSTYVSLCDREITPRWQKASATSITCTALPAISKSLKAIEKGISLCYNEVRFYPDDWQRIFASAVIHV